MDTPPAATALPSVALVVVNHNGAKHLGPCLDSVAALDYPNDRLEVIAVDNASTDDSVSQIRAAYPWVRLLCQERNLGFAAAVNEGAATASGDCLALLNSDMRVTPEWLTELVRMYDPGAGFPCVAGLILDWEGEQVDFADALINYEGHGNQIGVGTPVGNADIVNGRPLALACGGAMLVDRKLFIDIGGFDADYFAYYEDLDFSWRLRLLGYDIRLAAHAVSYHRKHGTAGKFPNYQRTRLYERNALRTLIKNLDATNLGPFLASTLLLLVKRAVIVTGADPAEYEIGAMPHQAPAEVDRTAVARLLAINDVLEDLDDLLAKRRDVQERRQRPDADIFERFGRPFQPSQLDSPEYLETALSVRRLFGLDGAFDRRRSSRVLIHTDTPHLGATDRAWLLAVALATLADVVLVSTGVVEPESHEIDVLANANEEDLQSAINEADVVVLMGSDIRRHRALQTARCLIACCLPPRGKQSSNIDRPALTAVLDTGDAFLCRTEEDRDYWLGMLAARGRIDRATHAMDPSLRRLIDVLDDTADDAGPLVNIVERPWLWGDRRGTLRRGTPLPEDAQRLLAQRRHAITELEAQLAASDRWRTRLRNSRLAPLLRTLRGYGRRLRGREPRQ